MFEPILLLILFIQFHINKWALLVKCNGNPKFRIEEAEKSFTHLNKSNSNKILQRTCHKIAVPIRLHLILSYMIFYCFKINSLVNIVRARWAKLQSVQIVFNSNYGPQFHPTPIWGPSDKLIMIIKWIKILYTVWMVSWLWFQLSDYKIVQADNHCLTTVVG